MAESCTPDGHEDKSDAVKVAPDAPDAPASPASSSDRGSLSSSNKVQPPADLRDDEKASVHRIVDHGQHEPSRDVDGRYGEKTGEDGGPGADPGADPEQPVQRRAASRASSSRSRAVTVVARSHRRGLLGRFCLLPEVTRPYDYDRRTKWFITFLVALAAGAAPVGSSIFYPALPQMAIDLHSTPIVTNLAVALYMLSISIFPLWWSSFSERLGRRSIYVVSFLLFIVFSVLAAVSSNVTMLIVMRAFAGGAAASVQAVGAGTIADVWEVHERGRAMGWFYLGPLMGPLLAPVIGGSLSQHFGWQATMWFLAIYGAVIWLFIVFCLPETLVRRAHKPQQPATAGPQPPATEEQEDRGPAVDAAGASEQPLGLTRTRSAARSLQEQTSRAANIFKQVIVDPLALVLYLRFPAVLATVLFAGVAFGSLFVLNISIQSTFSSPPYAYPQLIVGVLYVPPSIGYILGSVLGGPWMDYIMARNARRAGRRDPETGKLLYLPEQRLGENAWTAASVYPTALIAYGWMVQKGVHWAGPSVANLLFGFGSMLIFGCATTMLTEFMPRQSSSGVALNNFVRNILSCLGAVVGEPLISALGNGWLFTVVGAFCLIMSNATLIGYKVWGPRWRKSMDKQLNKEK